MWDIILFAVKYLYANWLKISIIPWILWFYFIWLEFFVVVVIWCFMLSFLDIMTWRFLAKQKWIFKSEEYMRWRFKRWVYYTMAWIATFFWRNRASLANTELLAVSIAMWPFIIRLWLALWEVDSLLENRSEFDKNNPVVKIIRKIIKILFRRAEKKVDIHMGKPHIVKFLDALWEWIDLAYYKAFVIKNQ